jgi:hypothetical protein
MAYALGVSRKQQNKITVTRKKEIYDKEKSKAL